MARNVQNCLVTVFLCVVVLLITGVSFPKYIASQNLKMHTLFNSSVASLKFISKELVSNKRENGVNASTIASKNEAEQFLESSSLPSIAFDSLQTPAKVKRIKRHTLSQKVAKDVFAWNFYLNVSRLGPTVHEASKNDLGTSAGKQLGAGVYVESQGTQKTALNELQRALESVGAFMENLFSSGFKNGTHDLKDINEMKIKQSVKEYLREKSDLAAVQNFNTSGSTEKKSKQPVKIPEKQIVPSFEESSPTSVETSQNSNTLKFYEGSGNESIHKGRKGRIFFNIFEFGGKLLGKTTPVSQTEESKNSMDDTETERNVSRTDEILLNNALQQKSEFVTENLLQKVGFHSDSLMSKTEHPSKDLNEDHNTEKLSLQPTMQQHECSGCVTGGFGLPVFPNEVNEGTEFVGLETTPTEIVFTDEILEKFCERFSNNLEEFHPILLEKSSETDVAMKGSLLINSDESTTEISALADKQSRFFSMFDSGSGRSGMSDENDLISNGQAGNFGDLPSVLDCENFYNKKKNSRMFHKSKSEDKNLESKIFSNFRNPTLAPKLEEQQQFPTNLNNFVQTLDEISNGEKANSVGSTTSAGNKHFTANNDLFINKNGEVSTELNKSNLNDKFGAWESTDLESEVQKPTDEQRDGRLFNFFSFGSGSEVQEDRNISESRWFLSDFFSSGARSLETSDNVNDSGVIVNLGEGESFQQIEDFSGDERMFAVSDKDTLENFSATSDQEHRFLSILGFAGSGSGRELIEITELIPTEFRNHVGSECGDDCSLHVVEEQSHECDDYKCDFEKSYGLENTKDTESASLIPLNESDCQGDCYPSTELLNKDKDSSLTSESTSHDSKNLTEYFKVENGAFPECDECNSNTLQMSDVPYTGSENNFFSEAPLLSQYLTTLNEEYESECNDCNKENSHNTKQITETAIVLETSESSYRINSNFTLSDMDYESPLTSFHSDGVDDMDYHDSTTYMVELLSITENPHQIPETTEMKPRLFVGPIFLTGSGDGGLFGDDGGTINLVEETSKISPNVSSRRRGRLDDLPIEPCDGCGDNGGNINMVEETSEISPNVSSRRRGRLDDLPIEPCDGCGDLLEERSLETAQNNQTASHFSSSTITKFEDVPATPMSRPTGDATTLKTKTENIAFPAVIFSNKTSSFPNVTLIERKPRSCIGAKDCNVTLGERCITINSSSVCDCGRTSVRQKETGKCVARGHVETTLKLPAEMFDSDLQNPESARYKLMSKKSVDTMWLLLEKTPEILRVVADVNVDRFSAGSLIISLNLVLAVENDSEAEIIKGMAEKLEKALGDEKVMKKASLNIRDATVVSLTSELDPCKSTKLNYCSKNAYCVRNDAKPGRFTCNCKEHYLDVSSDSLYPGEICIDYCPPLYCGLNGHCEIFGDGEKHCLCNGLYFGARCEIPGMVVLCSLSVAAFITLAVLCAVIIRIRCRKVSYTRTPTYRRSEEIGPHVIADGRISDAIALGECRGAKVSKFSQISTPMQPPVITVTRPTLNESSISFDCDDTFDVTPTSERSKSIANGISTN